jgi:hypothetical protein
VRKFRVLALLALGLAGCAAQQGAQVKPVADESLTCSQLQVAIANAKAAETKAEENKGNGVTGFVVGMLIPGALGNQEMSNQMTANQIAEATKARVEKLEAIYREKHCRG